MPRYGTTTTTTLPTTTTTTTTKLMGKHAVFDHSSFIFSENCQPWAAACQAKGLQPPSMKTMQMTWNQAACDAIAQGLGKTCSLGDYDNGATAMWCKRGTDACGTHGWGDNFDNYGLYNSDYGCVYHCALRSLPKSSDGKIILDPESYSGTYGYGVQVPYSGGSCPDGGRPIGMAHDVAGAKYDITIPATGLVSVSVQWGISGASDKSYLQWDRAPTASDNILVVGEESNNQLKTSSPVSLSAGSHTLWLGSAADGNYYTLPWCKIIVNLS